MKNDTTGGRRNTALVLGALGVVYGDIGTSPLYALRECFNPAHGLAASPTNVLGVLSLIFWVLILLVSVKYLTLVLRADNHGEGGILALLALAVPQLRGETNRRQAVLIILGLFGAALLYGDGMLTPTITVLGAIEGLTIATPAMVHAVVPLSIVILIALFSVQRLGSGQVGRVFGPVMLVWFVILAVLGIRGILLEPAVLGAVNPWHGLRFLLTHGWAGIVVLGSVFLVVTGAEALYADMGHFGRKPIRQAWFAVVLPGLFLNYLGQGALLLHDAAAADNPFYLLAPRWALYPMVALSTAAAVIASQALISGAYSLTMQAVQLGYVPRLSILHTSADERGQIYMPHVNWALMVACVLLVLGFRSSANLAAAYGIAVVLTMIITTILFYAAAQRLWGWSARTTGLVCAGFLIIEIAFGVANAMKLLQGGWLPLLIAAMVFVAMSTWKTGRRLVGERMRSSSVPVSLFLEDLEQSQIVRVPGTAVFLSGNSDATPLALLHNIKHNRVLHERVVLVNIQTTQEPYVKAEDRVRVERLRDDLFRVVGRYGFMEEPHVPRLLVACRDQGLKCDLNKITYFLSRETVVPKASREMAWWRKVFFVFLSRNAQSATAFFRIPANRVVELGMQVEV
jgi:KUP system potassium uptake protein